MIKPDFILDADIKIIMDWYNKGEENSPKALPRSIFDVMVWKNIKRQLNVLQLFSRQRVCRWRPDCFWIE